MGILKKFSLIALLFCTMSSFAQNQIDKEASFSSSYTKEAQGNYQGAIQDLMNVYEESSYPINLRLGWLNYMAGYFTKSITYYNKAIELSPLSIEAKLGLTYPAAAVSNWDMVMQQYQAILKVDKNNYTANLKLGQIHLNRKEYKKAEKFFDLLLSHYPFTYDVVINTAWNNYYLGKLREAKVLFNRALLLNPNDSSAKEGMRKIK